MVWFWFDRDIPYEYNMLLWIFYLYKGSTYRDQTLHTETKSCCDAYFPGICGPRGYQNVKFGWHQWRQSCHHDSFGVAMIGVNWRSHYLININLATDWATWLPVASLTKTVNPRLAKHPLVFNGDLANCGLTSLVKEATGDYWALPGGQLHAMSDWNPHLACHTGKQQGLLKPLTSTLWTYHWCYSGGLLGAFQ